MLAEDDISIEELIANLVIPPSTPPRPLPSVVPPSSTRVSSGEFAHIMVNDVAGWYAFKDEAERLDGIAKSYRRRKANIARADLRRAAGPPAPQLRQRKGYYAYGSVPLDTLAQINDDTRWLPFANGPSSYYWLWRFKRSKGDLRKALRMDTHWEAATRHRIDVTNARHIPEVYGEIFEHCHNDEEAARWQLVYSIAKAVGYTPQQNWQVEQERFAEAMDWVRSYNNRVQLRRADLLGVDLRQFTSNTFEISVKTLCQLIEESL